MLLPCYVKMKNGKEPDATFGFAKCYDGFDAAWDAVDMALRRRLDLPDGAFKVVCDWGLTYWLSEDGLQHNLTCSFMLRLAVNLRYGDEAEIVTCMDDESGGLGAIHIPNPDTGQRKVVADLFGIMPSILADDASGKLKHDFYAWLDAQVGGRPALAAASACPRAPAMTEIKDGIAVAQKGRGTPRKILEGPGPIEVVRPSGAQFIVNNTGKEPRGRIMFKKDGREVLTLAIGASEITRPVLSLIELAFNAGHRRGMSEAYDIVRSKKALAAMAVAGNA
ncbi:hypothetical protein [Bradyrhizobium betae]|uniref:Uncharacterized protein n=1 Tax=Bradyrhizobium betae TaxID=244734 RepID=A0A5P6P8Z1_9BRAD|nr:hypothetical protein [Bradyrhizobium betae]MCS3727239.1 hypothetical protein [Bradyrhizobium betae]QFI74849.1 hypothetical protein F8237_22035 [Bradyrhizobium betae]